MNLEVDLTNQTLTEAPETRRGVSPEILLTQVHNTAPFIFDPSFPKKPYVEALRKAERLAQDGDAELSHPEYFRLCLSAHYATVASYVPTDVDNQIRFKLWNPALPTETLVSMGKIVLESYTWDWTPVSSRWVRSETSGKLLGGHSGEWFSIAVAAYGALRRRSPDDAAEVAGFILREIQNETQVFSELRKTSGIGALKAATLIAHNLGDLDRVFDMWNLPDEDPLKQEVYKCGHEKAGKNGKTRFSGALYEAGELNKAYMAAENHRHFALRASRSLRKFSDLLLPIGPFFDDWGLRIAKHPGLDLKDIGNVAENLVTGWEKLSKNDPAPLGYARALSGILDAFPGGFSELSHYIPARVERTLKSGALRALISVPKRRFEDQWNQFGLNKHA